MTKGIDYVGISVIFFCHNGKGKFVMQKRGAGCRDEKGTWDIGGGALEVGDSVEQTLRKEIKEEYLAEVLEFEFLGFRDVFRVNETGQKTHWLALDYKVLVDEFEVKNGEPNKFDEIRWFDFNSLPSPLFSQLDYFIEKYKGRL